MKRSFTISAIIIIAAALLGWREEYELSRNREVNEELLRMIANDPRPDFQSPINMERRKEDRARRAKVKSLASDLFAIYLNAAQDPNTVSGEELARLQTDLKSRLEELDPSEIKQFMEVCNNNPDLNIQIKQAINVYVQRVFIQKYPIEMARMMSQSPEQFGIGDEKIEDPFQYLVYYYSGEKPDLPTVFQILAEAPPEFQAKYIGQVTRFGTETPLSRGELLEEMRYFANTQERQELVNDQLSDLVFARAGGRGSFVELSDFLASANLSNDELVAATENIQKNVRVGETGQWLDWLARTDIPDEIAKERAFGLASRWTEKDYKAVGAWLNTAPQGPEKTAVAGAYAAKTHPYDPENAMKWIQTIPQGPDRSKALEIIYKGMQKNGNYASEAIEAFAREHGFEE